MADCYKIDDDVGKAYCKIIDELNSNFNFKIKTISMTDSLNSLEPIISNIDVFAKNIIYANIYILRSILLLYPVNSSNSDNFVRLIINISNTKPYSIYESYNKKPYSFFHDVFKKNVISDHTLNFDIKNNEHTKSIETFIDINYKKLESIYNYIEERINQLKNIDITMLEGDIDFTEEGGIINWIKANAEIMKARDLLGNESPIMIIADKNNFEMLQKFIGICERYISDFDITECVMVQNKDGYNAIDIIVKKLNDSAEDYQDDNADILPYFLKLFSYVYDINKNGDTSLTIAASTANCNQYVFQELLEIYNHQSMNIQNNEGNSALIIAVKNNRFDIVEILINKYKNKNRDIVTAQNNEGNTAIIIAVKNNRLDILNKLLEVAPLYSFNIQNKEGNTALIIAVKNNNADIVTTLLEKNADTDTSIKNANGEDAIMCACKNNIPSIFGLLLDNGADPNITYENGKFNLFGTAIRGKYTEIVKKLIDCDRADINIKELGYTPIMVSIKYISEEMVKKDISSSMEIFDLILNTESRVRIDEVDGLGNTALIMAVQLELKDIVNKLLEHSPDIQIRNKEGYTALMVSLKNQKWKIFDILMENIAEFDFDIKAVDGHTVISYAIYLYTTDEKIDSKSKNKIVNLVRRVKGKKLDNTIQKLLDTKVVVSKEDLIKFIIDNKLELSFMDIGILMTPELKNKFQIKYKSDIQNYDIFYNKYNRSIENLYSEPKTEEKLKVKRKKGEVKVEGPGTESTGKGVGKVEGTESEGKGEGTRVGKVEGPGTESEGKGKGEGKGEDINVRTVSKEVSDRLKREKEARDILLLKQQKAKDSKNIENSIKERENDIFTRVNKLQNYHTNLANIIKYTAIIQDVTTQILDKKKEMIQKILGGVTDINNVDAEQNFTVITDMEKLIRLHNGRLNEYNTNKNIKTEAEEENKDIKAEFNEWSYFYLEKKNCTGSEKSVNDCGKLQLQIDLSLPNNDESRIKIHGMFPVEKDMYEIKQFDEGVENFYKFNEAIYQKILETNFKSFFKNNKLFEESIQKHRAYSQQTERMFLYNTIYLAEAIMIMLKKCKHNFESYNKELDKLKEFGYSHYTMTDTGKFLIYFNICFNDESCIWQFCKSDYEYSRIDSGIVYHQRKPVSRLRSIRRKPVSRTRYRRSKKPVSRSRSRRVSKIRYKRRKKPVSRSRSIRVSKIRYRRSKKPVSRSRIRSRRVSKIRYRRNN